MNIIELPIEIQENIIIHVDKQTQIQLVCKLWNEICKKKPISNKRDDCTCLDNVYKCTTFFHKCICPMGSFSSINCRGHYHKCVCNISALNCKYKGEHPCICKNSARSAGFCRYSGEHPCICHRGRLNIKNCRATKHPCVCNMGPISASNCQAETHQHPCICEKGYWSRYYCKYNNHT